MKRKSKKARNAVFIIIVFALVAVLVFLAFRHKPGSEKEHKLAAYMETEEVARGDIRKTVSAQGPLLPYETVHVRSEATGEVAKMLVDVGDRVAEGDPLVELDQEDLLISLRRAEAAVKAAKANLEQQKKGWLPNERARVEEEIKARELDLEQAEADLKRVKKLHEAGFASDSELEDALYARDMAALNLDNSKEQLDILLDGSPVEIVDYYEANYRMAKADYDSAVASLGEATIFSPMDGVVLERFISEGSVVVSTQASLGGGGDLICLIGDLSRMKVQGLVDESDIGQLEIGQKAIIEVDAFEDEEFEAHVTKINPMGNVTTTVTNFEVEMEIDNSDGKLLPNLTAHVNIVIDERTDVVMVPERAVLKSGGDDYVFVVDDDDILHQRKVELGITDYDNVEILGGVEEGEKIVVKGVPTKPFEEKES